MGYNLKKMIYEVAGGIRGGRKLKAVVPGGSSTPVLLPEEIENLGMDFDQVGKAGSMLGSGGVVVIDDQTCIVEFALRTISFYQHESCGWCIPCREGTDWLKKSLTRFHAGFGTAKDIDNIQYLAENMMGRTFCPLGDAAAMPTMGFVKKFRKEFEDHLNGKPCPFAKARSTGKSDRACRRSTYEMTAVILTTERTEKSKDLGCFTSSARITTELWGTTTEGT